MLLDARHGDQDSFACPHEKQCLLLLSVAANRVVKEAGLYSSYKSTDLSKDVPTKSERALFGENLPGAGGVLVGDALVMLVASSKENNFELFSTNVKGIIW